MSILPIAWLVMAGQVAGAAARPADGAVIRGRVIDRETGEPLGRAVVTLVIPPSTTRDVSTGPDGRYEFRDVPPGQVMVHAVAGEYRATHVEGYPRLPGGASWEPLKPGEVRADADIVLARALAISGRVIGPAGQPLARVQVRVQRVDGRSGAFGMPRPTDDRGMFRLFGLDPGRYYVCAEGASISMMGLRAVHQRERYVRTCHPAAAGESDAEAVAVSAADVEGIDIRMRRSPSYTVQGTVFDAEGQPVASGMVELVQSVVEGHGSTTPTTMRAGEFTFTGVTPGQYAVVASLPGGAEPGEVRDSQRGYALFRVDTADVRGLTITLKRPVNVSGRIIFEGTQAAPEPADRSKMSVEARQSVMLLFPLASPDHATVRDDLTFELSGLAGPLRLELRNPPSGWMVKSITYRHTDITRSATEFRQGDDKVEIVLTDRGARVSGRVADEHGAPAAGIKVVLFPADRAQWQPGSLFETTTWTKKGGEFEFAPRPAGEYLIVALARGVEIPNTYTLSLFERLAKIAERLTLLEYDRRTLSLRVADLPGERQP